MRLPPFHYWVSIDALSVAASFVISTALAIFGLKDALSQRWRYAVLAAALLVALLGWWAIASQEQANDGLQAKVGALQTSLDSQGKTLTAMSGNVARIASGVGLKTNASPVDVASAILRRERDALQRQLGAYHSHSHIAAPTLPDSSSDDRGAVIRQLTQLYILSHDGITPEMAAGLQLPSVDYLNAQLEKLHMTWRVKRTDGPNAETYDLPG